MKDFTAEQRNELLNDNMFGFESEREKQICFNGFIKENNYKGWNCIYLGCGTMIFKKGFEEIRTHRGEEVKNWVYECWKEVKLKIDDDKESTK